MEKILERKEKETNLLKWKRYQIERRKKQICLNGKDIRKKGEKNKFA